MGLRPFADIVDAAAARHGGIGALEARLSRYSALTRDAVAALPDSRVLAAMARAIFSAGFSAKVIEKKWAGFEEAFWDFDPGACAAMDQASFDRLLADARIVRNATKVLAVQKNAAWLGDLAGKAGSASRFFADWPDEDYVGLIEVMLRDGDRLGGDTGPRFLRAIGKPAFLFSGEVAAALAREGVIERSMSGKGDRRRAQDAFNAWAAETGRDFSALSRILALSLA